MAGAICFSDWAIGIPAGSIARSRLGCHRIVVNAARHATGLGWIVLLMCLAGCVPLGTPVVSEVSPAQAEAITGDVFVVRKGDTLYSIAWRAGKDHKTLAQINGIEPPFVIYPGQRLQLKPAPVPKTAPKPASVQPATRQSRSAKSTAPRTTTVAPAAQVKTKPKPKVQVSTAAVTGKKPPRQPAKSSKRTRLVWVRPIKQNPNVGFGNGSKGWDYQVRGKTRMRSASAGQVVYAGNGIAGYERLVIVKHSGNLLSAYSFNGRILVNEQQTVRTGQSLAELTSRNGNSQKVHFELRRDGNPINPKSLIKPG